MNVDVAVPLSRSGGTHGSQAVWVVAHRTYDDAAGAATVHATGGPTVGDCPPVDATVQVVGRGWGHGLAGKTGW